MSHKNRTILLVEDAFTREGKLKSFLDEKGFKTVVVKSTTFSLDDLRSVKPDILITDLDQGEDDPLAILTAISKESAFGNVEIFIFSDAISVQTELALRRLRISSYFLKNQGCDAVVKAAVRQFDEVVQEDYDTWREEMYRQTQPIYTYAPGTGISPVPLSPPPPPPPPPQDEYIDTSGGSGVGRDLDDIFGAFHAASEQPPAASPEGTNPSRSPEEIYAEGVAALEAGEVKTAIEALSRVITYPPLTRNATIKLGVAYQRGGKYKEALETLQRAYKNAIEEEDKNECRYHIGLSLQAVGRIKEAYQALAYLYKSDNNYRDVKKRLLEMKQKLQGK